MKLQQLFGETWYAHLKDFVKSNDWETIEDFIRTSKKNKLALYPAVNYLFRPYAECPMDKVKVVILNNAPYEHEDANDGLAFSISNPDYWYKPPAGALAFMEGLENDVHGGLNFNRSYDLHPLTQQGVLLLNASLTIAKDENGAWEDHYNVWKPLIKKTLTSLAQNFENIVFIFVGVKDFEALADIIVPTKNYILTVTHPSEANHFAQTYNTANTFKLANALLRSNKIKEIKW